MPNTTNTVLSVTDDGGSDSGVYVVFAIPTLKATLDITKLSINGIPGGPPSSIGQVDAVTVQIEVGAWPSDPMGYAYAIASGFAPGVAPSSGTVS